MKMEWFSRMFATFMIVLFGVIIYLLLQIAHVFEPSVETGQHWIAVHYEDNPFRVADTTHYFILEVKDDYVKYAEESFKGRVSTDQIHWFRSAKELVDE